MIREISASEQDRFNSLVPHIMQSYQWGEFREKTGVRPVRLAKFRDGEMVEAMQATFHDVPRLGGTVGYVPKGVMPDLNWIEAWKDLGAERNAVFIKFEPEVLESDGREALEKLQEAAGVNLREAKKPIFTKYNFLVDLTRSEEDLFMEMKSKTRYNVRLAERKGVEVEKRTDEKAFEIYLDLYFKTTERQDYYGHDRNYHRKVWETLMPRNEAFLLIGSFEDTPLAAWMMFRFGDTIYYPYGGSSTKHRDKMASGRVCWRAMVEGKKLGCRVFDMWGAARVPDPDRDDPYYGFHRFKAGYGGELVEYLGSYDLVLDSKRYELIHLGDKLRWAWLKASSRLGF